jgi:hypothetical protein
MSNLTDHQKAELEKKIRDSIPNGWENTNISCGCTTATCVVYRGMTLQDVLIALSNANCVSLERNVDGTMTMQIDECPPRARYDLTKPYHDQSEEFYAFLYSVLCP